MAEKTALFHRLTLSNFKLHRLTEIDLAARPILLVTGANGSGKTQILEALRLALGVVPATAKSRGIAAMIGPHQAEAEVSLAVLNPLEGERRTITTSSDDLNPELNADSFVVAARIRASGIEYRLTGASGRAKRIRRRDVREIFRAASVHPENRLAFTEEGVVDVFASETDRRKLEIFLETVGKKQYLDDLAEAHRLLEDAKQQAEPLRQKVEWDRSMVKRLREALEIIRRRTELTELLERLTLEHAWGLVRDREDAVAELETQIGRVEARIDAQDTLIQELEITETSQDALVSNLRGELSALDESLDRSRSLKAKLSGSLEQLGDHLEDYGRQRSELRKRRTAMEKSLKDGGEAEAPDVGLSELKKLESAVTKKRRECTKISQSLEHLRERLRGSVAGHGAPGSQRMTHYELNMVRAARVFHAEVRRRGLADRIVGPIVSLVTLRPGEELWEDAVKALLGRYLFSFVATDRDAFVEAKRIFDEAFRDSRPPLTVARHSPDRPRREPRRPGRRSMPRPVRGFAIDLIDGEEHCLAFLRKVLRGAVAEDAIDPNEATDFTEAARVPMITQSCDSYYIPAGAFRSPPATLLTPLGATFDADDEGSSLDELTPDRLLAQVEELTDRRIAAQTEWQALERQADRLRGEAGGSTQPGQQIESLSDRLVDTDAAILRMQAKQDRLGAQIRELDEELEQRSTQEAPLRKKLAKAEEELRNTSDSLIENRTERQQQVAVRDRLRAERGELQATLAEALEPAQTLGERPGEIRETHVVNDEKNEVKGKLDTIVGEDASEEHLANKEEELKRAEAYLEERTAHMENLARDVQHRHELWREEVHTLIERVAVAMKRLMVGPAFRDVRLYVRDIDTPEQAGLKIQAKTKTDQWLNYAELSGGEKVLCTESLIMALHTLADSPLHAIDEFTQRLDKANSAAAFNVVRRAFEMTAQSHHFAEPQFILVCPEAFGLETSDLIQHVVTVEGRMETIRK